MPISPDQSRAARGLLNWTQEDLAKNACVSRATIADFEGNSRLPFTNNLRSMEDSLFAAGVEFIPEKDKFGVGVRFRDRKLQYVSNLKIAPHELRASMWMKYAGQDFRCVIDLGAVNDFHRKNFNGVEEFQIAISKMLHVILSTVEKRCSVELPGEELIIGDELLN